MNRARAVKLLLQDQGVEAVCLARALRDRAAWRRLTAHEQCNANEPFIADDRNFGGRAVFHHVEQRDDRRGRKIDVIEPIAGFVDDLPQGHIDAYQMRGKTSPLRLWQNGEQMIPFRMIPVHHLLLLDVLPKTVRSFRRGARRNQRGRPLQIIVRRRQATSWRVLTNAGQERKFPWAILSSERNGISGDYAAQAAVMRTRGNAVLRR
jgi:hypothetical protein